MPLNPDHCPADPGESAEQYVLGKLTPEDATAFGDHFIVYPACAHE